MKLIHNFKSPNFNERSSKKIELIIIHYTGIKSVTKSIKHLCSKKNKVSCHYLISNKGEIFNLVSEKKRAWHAGQSYWNGKKDINSYSIGIELDYSPFEKNNKFTYDLKKSLLFIIKKLVIKYNITPKNVLGHSDVAPYRKIDPGKIFPWDMLENNNLANKILVIKNNKITRLLEEWFFKFKFYTAERRILFMLGFIGYDVSLALIKNNYFEQLLLVYFNRYKLSSVSTFTKKNVYFIIYNHFANLLLTKIEK